MTEVGAAIECRLGRCAFALDDGVVYHKYSACARGRDALWGVYRWLDRAPLGRNEARGDDDPINFYRRHDEYESRWPAGPVPSHEIDELGAFVLVTGRAADAAEPLRHAASENADEWTDQEAAPLLLDAATLAAIGA